MIVVYGIDNCQWCEKTKVLLGTHGTPFHYIHVNDSEKSEFLDNFTKVFGGDRTFPRVLRNTHGDPIGGELIGGFDNTLEEVLHGRI